MQFDRVVVIARRPVGMVYLEFGVGQRGFSIAAANFSVLTHDLRRHNSVSFGGGEGCVRSFLLIGNPDQRAGVFGSLQRLGYNQGHWLPVPEDLVRI